MFGQDRNWRDYFTFLTSCFNPSHLGQGNLCAYGGEFLANNFPVGYGYIFLVLISGEKIGGIDMHHFTSSQQLFAINKS